MSTRRAGRGLRVLVSGRIAAAPGQGGAAWAVLQYLHGLAELGHAVDFVEAVDDEQVRPKGAPLARSANASYADAVLSDAGFEGRWALLAEGRTETVGLPYDTLTTTRWDVLVNLSGCLRDEQITGRIPVRIYVDVDPAFSQAWAEQGYDVGLDGHTAYVTVGSRIGSPGCPIPQGGVEWRHLLPPVVLSRWTTSGEVTIPAMTTVANWRSYGSVDLDGVRLGQRVHAFRAFLDLPGRTSVRLAPALAIHEDEVDDVAALRAHGWTVIDPASVAAMPAAYRDFVRASLGELSIAKSGYVTSDSGWFSDRSACYLASARPVVAQDTGFGELLPTGDGLFAFSTPEEAADALERVRADWATHARAARAIAVEHLDSARVLTGLLDGVGVSP